MTSSATPLHLPPNLPYPITVTRISSPVESKVTPGVKLLEYSFRQSSPAGPSTSSHKSLLLFGSWDCSIEGIVEAWNIKVGQTLSLTEAKSISLKGGVVLIKEKCRHDIQIGGMCAVCGEDMTRIDYTGFSPSSLATLPSTHLARGPTVSLHEAKRLAEEQKEWLLRERKLSLIVDLDQTVVHATVDPTVGEWITEGQAWEAEQAVLNSESTNEDTQKPDSAGEDGSKRKKRKRPPNPNWPAMKDVASFKLAPEAAGLPPGMRGKAAIPAEGSVYYIKPRPGWENFLRNLAKYYDLHIYTMGTRSYALQVLNILDPEQKLFGNKVLSRDESGNISFKSLKRLFPVDTSMVVVIDDRGDVWEWCENLVKVKPYDFFVGIGDINSAFLPKQTPLVPSSVPMNGTPASPPIPTNASPPEGEEETADSTLMQIKEQGRILEAQMEDRPLAKSQEKLNDETNSGGSVTSKEDKSKEGDAESEPEEEEEIELKPLLTNDDSELGRVEGVLMEVHKRFFDAYDIVKNREKGTVRKQNGQGPLRVDHDVTKIIPRIRQRTFQGLHLLFSSIIPLDQDPSKSEVWRQARLYGAICHSDLNDVVTHVVAAKPGTMKVDMAKRKGGIFIVKANWFTDSINAWEKQDEQLYLLEAPSPRAEPPVKSPGESHSRNVDVDVENQQPGGVAQEIFDEFEDNDEEDLEDLNIEAQQELEPIALGTWQDANDEVDAYLMESDSEFGDDEESLQDVIIGDGESESGSAPGTPSAGSRRRLGIPGGLKRRRSRSSTPSGLPARQLELTEKEIEVMNLCSPLAKRRKIADQRGSSGLRQEVSISEGEGEEQEESSQEDPAPPKNGQDQEIPMKENDGGTGEDYASEYDEVASSIASEDDFLAAELELD